MKALSVIEPWASLIACGLKRKETRSWYTPFRGPVAIHASKSKEVVKHFDEVEFLFEEAGLEMPRGWPKKADEYPLGQVLCVTTIEECRPMTLSLIGAQSQQERAFGAWAEERFAWFLGDVRRLLVPFPCRGALGLWDLPAAIDEADLLEINR